MKTIDRKTVLGLVFSGAIALTATGTFAATTTIQDSSSTGEAQVVDILNTVYGGGTGVASGDQDSSITFNNGITANRVDDNDDQTFDFSPFSASAKAVFADFGQTFGYIPGSSGGSFNELFNVTGSQYAVGGSDSSVVPSQTPFRFARTGSSGLLASSLNSGNPDGDHLVTYTIDGLADAADTTTYALFFEDRMGFDYDYNDLAVQIKATDAVPTPTAAFAGFAMLGGMVIRRRRRQR